MSDQSATSRPKRTPFADALDQAVRSRGLSVAELSRRLHSRGTPLATSAIGYWRSGQRQPERVDSFDALENLEGILRLERGEMTSLIGPPRRRGPSGRRTDVRELLVRDVELALSELGLDGDSGIAEFSAHHVLDIDSAGRLYKVTMRTMFRATRDGVDRRALMAVRTEFLGSGCRFIVRGGGSLGREVHQPERGVDVAELIFDRPLRAGELWVTEHELIGEPQACTYWEMPLPRVLHEAMIWVRFDARQTPGEVVVCTETEAIDEHRRVPLGGDRSVRHIAHAVGPGRMRVVWGDVDPTGDRRHQP